MTDLTTFECQLYCIDADNKKKWVPLQDKPLLVSIDQHEGNFYIFAHNGNEFVSNFEECKEKMYINVFESDNENENVKIQSKSCSDCYNSTFKKKAKSISLPTPNIEQLIIENRNLKKDIDKLKIALFESSTNAEKWQNQFQLAINSKAKLSTILQESCKNVENWKKQFYYQQNVIKNLKEKQTITDSIMNKLKNDSKDSENWINLDQFQKSTDFKSADNVDSTDSSGIFENGLEKDKIKVELLKKFKSVWLKTCYEFNKEFDQIKIE
ncbi:hypothetical protein A3Q56_00677 [Intoshia linei]|uniref:WH1 domain-containing protein n=1 Tax=Intoshia linei TaxID=1819745 RepID=A0A177BDF7_9BILA|nr:hypothetical protein A3Q56_00677 [Intoshia linei]